MSYSRRDTVSETLVSPSSLPSTSARPSSGSHSPPSPKPLPTERSTRDQSLPSSTPSSSDPINSRLSNIHSIDLNSQILSICSQLFLSSSSSFSSKDSELILLSRATELRAKLNHTQSSCSTLPTSQSFSKLPLFLTSSLFLKFYTETSAETSLLTSSELGRMLSWEDLNQSQLEDSFIISAHPEPLLRLSLIPSTLSSIWSSLLEPAVSSPRPGLKSPDPPLTMLLSNSTNKISEFQDRDKMD